MSENIAYGWIRAWPKKEKIKITAENILSDLLPPSAKELRQNGYKLSNCIFRDGSLFADFERENKSEKFHLFLNPSENYGEILRLDTHHVEKVVTLKEKENSEFKRYFEFDTVYQGRVLAWQMGILDWKQPSQT